LKIRVAIDNRPGKMTSQRAARQFVERGIAEWSSADFSRIRFKASQDLFEQRKKNDDETYWRRVEAERQGTISYQMRVVATRPTVPGGPKGLSTLAFFPVYPLPKPGEVVS
jgi:hypothetical protein